MINIVLFGPLGSGKGTQAKKIADKYGFIHFSTGELLREEIRKQTKIGKKIKSIVNSGALVPDDIMEEIVENFLKENCNTKGIIFDGFPRTLRQAKMLDEELEKYNLLLDLIIKLDVPEEIIKSRLLYRAQKEGRTDDNEAIISKRLKYYYRDTLPVLDYYKQTNKNIVSICGHRDVDIVFNDICLHIDKILLQKMQI
ncbi:MAG: adenylate kinase [Bacteroidales bacterium]|jgi:adenylate kinase|nr:adenylate kinase [Bacteroidales bacterium]MDI9575815.1 adenylate kinase [Bacteroidota bacterium]MDD3755600.1 adenylate kinase [Bacteroidales bacterium]MDY0400733.1 adenylate kinase [Bacteroidales bacterium]HHW59190.1 adenylate kinase [Bacteroidales bacterium]